MSIALDHFNLLAFEDQITAVWDQGRYIATRYEEEDTVGLYHMAGGFFVELFYDDTVNHLVERTRPFPAADLDSLDDYALCVSLGGLKLP